MNNTKRGLSEKVQRFKYVLTGIIMGILFWFVEAAIHTYIFHDGTLISQIFTPHAHEIWMRSLVVVFFIGMGIYVQLSVARRSRIEHLVKIQRDLAIEFLNADSIMGALKFAFQTILRATGLDCGGIYLADEETAALNLAYHEGLSDNFSQAVSHFAADSPNVKLVQEGKLLYMDYDKVAVPKSKVEEEEGLTCIAIVPILYRDQVIGCMNVSSHKIKETSEENKEIFESLVGQVGQGLRRFRLEEDIKKERDKAQTYLDIAGVILVALDRDAKVTLINKKGCEILETEEQEIIGKNWFDNFLPVNERTPIKEVFNQLMNGEIEQTEYYENYVVSKTGQEKLIAWHNINLSDLEGNLIGTLSSGEDITERREVELELQNYRKHLEELVEARTAQLTNAVKELESFSYSVSHDLRSPLRAIDGFSQVILEEFYDAVDEKGKDYLKRIRAASQRMGRLIDDLLKLAQLSRTSLEIEKVDLSAIAEVIIQKLQNKELERKVEVKIPPGLVVMGDNRLLRVLMQNLLDNAWKFTSKQAHAKIEFGTFQKEGETIYYVRDNGAGFDSNYMNKLFVPFQRLHSLAEFDGIGIGLATVQRIINRHRGRIWAESAVEHGATFYFTLNPKIIKNEEGLKKGDEV